MSKFEPKGLGAKIFTERYALTPDETFQDACSRVAKHVATAEEPHLVGLVTGEFEALLQENLFMPGGRTWHGAGRPRGQLLNCFVVPTSDSREGWGQTLYDTLVISGTGGGVGINCSPVRPRGAPIHGAGGYATGPVSLMNMINSMGDELKAGGGRRVALMLSLDAEHKDLPEFLDAKLDLGRLNNANVSVVFNGDPTEWIEDPANKESWDKIVANSLKGGEPGLLNVGLANKMSNVGYWNKLVTSNPCGEIIMAPYECCCLGSLVLPRFVSDGAVDFGKLGKAVKTAVRFLDNVLSVNNYPLPIIEKTCNDVRRIGLGVMGLHDMLLLMGHKYSSPEGRNMVDMVMAFIKNEAYLASANLAEEKGAFPVYDSSQEAGFADTELGTHFAAAVRAKGLRNCAVLTIPPTGTTSMVAGVTSGIEPMFAPAYERRYFAPDNSQQMEVVFHPLFEEFLSGGKDVEHFEGAHDITPEDHLKMQTVCQKHVDNAVSKTINIPPGFPEEEFSSLLKRYLPQLKGITVYPEGSRENQPLTPIGLDDAKAMRSDSVEATAIDTCKDGKCEI